MEDPQDTAYLVQGCEMPEFMTWYERAMHTNSQFNVFTLQRHGRCLCWTSIVGLASAHAASPPLAAYATFRVGHGLCHSWISCVPNRDRFYTGTQSCPHKMFSFHISCISLSMLSLISCSCKSKLLSEAEDFFFHYSWKIPSLEKIQSIFRLNIEASKNNLTIDHTLNFSLVPLVW